MVKRRLSQKGFVWIIILLNLALAAYATPLYDLGDNLDYLELSRSLLGYPVEHNVAHRSPLYSILLAGFMLCFESAVFYKAVIVFQYLLVGCSAWMVYQLGERIFNRREWAMCTALLFNLSFATIFYANDFLTEILTVFLLVWSVYELLKIKEEGRLSQYALLGTIVGLTALARFNMVPLVGTFLVLMGIILFQQKANLRKWIFAFLAFLIPYLILINGWCFYNYTHNGFYGLFPGKGLRVTRNIVVACIRPDDRVSANNQAILDIFNNARVRYLATIQVKEQGSLSRFDKYDILVDLYSGYSIYLEATPALVQYFGLSSTAGDYELSQKLLGFYQEIIGQNQGTIFKFRFLSFFNGFRASTSGMVPARYGKINLNVLPAFFFKLYKITVLAISFFVFIALSYFLIRGIRRGWKFDFNLLVFFGIVMSVWGINFVFVTVGDANRFKFPVEPFIILLFVYYVEKIYRYWLKSRGKGSIA